MGKNLSRLMTRTRWVIQLRHSRRPSLYGRRRPPAPAPPIIPKAAKEAGIVVAMQTGHAPRQALLVDATEGQWPCPCAMRTKSAIQCRWKACPHPPGHCATAPGHGKSSRHTATALLAKPNALVPPSGNWGRRRHQAEGRPHCGQVCCRGCGSGLHGGKDPHQGPSCRCRHWGCAGEGHQYTAKEHCRGK